jgi:hypothetical protein
MTGESAVIPNPVNETAYVNMATRSDALYFVCTGIGKELRTLHANLLSEQIPERMAEVLKQLDQPTEDERMVMKHDHRIRFPGTVG